MTQYWGALSTHGRPEVPGQMPWPRFGQDSATLSLRAGGHSTVIDDATHDAEHSCSFWTTLPAVGRHHLIAGERREAPLRQRRAGFGRRRPRQTRLGGLDQRVPDPAP